jgi:flagellar biosynthesis GTPase FlhF
LPDKRRKDAVLAIEYLITASPEFFKTKPWKMQREYFNAAIEWLKERHGTENVVCLNLQLDETSPHLVAYCVPITKDGRLSAKDFLGGRKILSAMQTDFAERVGKRVGLERGVEGSKAKHTTAKQYAAALNKAPGLAPPAKPEPTVADRFTGRAKDQEQQYQQDQARYVAQVEQACNVALVSQQSRQAQVRAIEEQRQKTAELKVEKEKAEADRLKAEQEAEAAKVRSDRLARENKQLRQQAERQAQVFSERVEQQEKAFAAERRRFMATIDGLKERLASAFDEIKELVARVRSLERLLFAKKTQPGG